MNPSQKTGPTDTVLRKAGRSDLLPIARGYAMSAGACDNAFNDCDRAAVYRAIFTRRDVRSDFVAEPIDDAVLARLIRAAHHAPSVGFMQPWNFIVIRAMDQREKVRDLFLTARMQEEAQIAGNKKELYRRLRLEGICESALNVCITCDRDRSRDSPLGRWHNPEMDLFSTVCAVQNFWLAARAEGIGVGWVSILDQPALKTLLDIPDHVAPVAYLCVGRVSDFAPVPELQRKNWRRRLPLGELVMSERFGVSSDAGLAREIGGLTEDSPNC
jgi:5,6-dimethylbenzimidazole synthase